MASYIFLVGFFNILTMSFPYSEAQMVPAMFVFGDSLVDVGNNNYLTLSFVRSDFSHNGIDFPGKKPTGRFSNGKNTADFLGTCPNRFLFHAEKLGLRTSPPPYLSLTSISNKSNAFLGGGVSFASGGAGILGGIDPLYPQTIPLNKQIQYYSRVYEELVQQLGIDGAQKYISKSLFAFVIGSIDILDYLGSEPTLRDKNTHQQYLDLMISTLGDQLKLIYNLGARKFIMVGVAALGCCPSQRNHNRSGECNNETNTWSLKFNEGVKSLLQGLKSELNDINYSYFDTYSVLLNFIQNPSVYGFTEVKAACCGLGNLKAKVACLPISSYCPNRSDHIFWDFYHPTEAAAYIVTDTIFDGPQQYLYPVNVRQLVAM